MVLVLVPYECRIRGVCRRTRSAEGPAQSMVMARCPAPDLRTVGRRQAWPYPARMARPSSSGIADARGSRAAARRSPAAFGADPRLRSAGDPCQGGERPPSGGLSRALRVRQVWNTVNLSTALGLMVARAAGCRVQRGPHGLVLAHGYRWGFPDGGAVTVGNVVLVRSGARPTALLLEHESRHATQYAVCLGLPFLPLYGLAVAWSRLRTGDNASRNVFERHAGLQAGGYREAPVRWPRRRR